MLRVCLPILSVDLSVMFVNNNETLSCDGRTSTNIYWWWWLTQVKKTCTELNFFDEKKKKNGVYNLFILSVRTSAYYILKLIKNRPDENSHHVFGITKSTTYLNVKVLKFINILFVFNSCINEFKYRKILMIMFYWI